MRASECEVVSTYNIVRNGQVLKVKRYAPTKADAAERDHSQLDFHRKGRVNARRWAGDRRWLGVQEEL